LVLALCLITLPANFAAATSEIPSDANFVRSLDGQWRFKLEQAGDYPDHGSTGGKPLPIVLPKSFEPFQTLDYKEDRSWCGLTVPGNWDMAGFSPPSYNQPDNAIGLYRLEFDVPAEWQDRVVKINFDGVQNGAEVYLNGQPVNVDEPSEGKSNFHQGGFTAFQADLTPVVKFGQKNLLAIRVYKNAKAVELDSGDYFFMGGVHRTVTLFSVPKSHVDDLAVQTKLMVENQVELRVILRLAEGLRGVKASMHLQGQSAIDGTSNEQGVIELQQTLKNPKLWSAEHPNLYDLSVDLKDESGKPLEHFSRRVGVREISIKDGVLMINNVPVKFTGMCRHDCYATLGSALNEEVWRKDIELMKAANVNAIRTSHYPYGSKFYDLCDELGMYVMDEMAGCWVPTDTDELTPAFQQHAR
jgi:beta-galactosidase/beta-glucuronidase